MAGSCILLLIAVLGAQGLCAFRLFQVWQQMPGRPKGSGDRVNAIVESLRDARDVLRAEPVRRLVRLIREGAGWLVLGTLITWVSVPLFMLCILSAVGGA